MARGSATWLIMGLSEGSGLCRYSEQATKTWLGFCRSAYIGSALDVPEFPRPNDVSK